MTRLAALASLCALAVGLIATGLSAGAKAPCAPGRDGWISLPGPPFGLGDPSIGALTVMDTPGRHGTPVVTNGDQVFAGDLLTCSWRELYSLQPSADPLVPLSAGSADIVRLAWGEGALHLAVEEDLGPASRVHVITLRAERAGWASLHRGLPAAATRVLALEVSPADPARLYLLVDEGTGAALYASRDAGMSWERRSALPAVLSATGLALDPLVPGHLWAYGGGLKRSIDGGRSWQAIDALGTSISLADVFHAPGAPARVLAYEPEGMTFWRSDDDGSTWRVFGAPSGDMQSIVSGAGPDSVLVSLHQGVYRFRPPSYWVEETPQNHDGLFELTTDRHARPWIFGRSAERVLIYSVLDERLEPVTFNVVPAEMMRSRAALQARPAVLSLAPGKRRSVRASLTLPPSPTPLDVFFLVDTTESMQSSIDALRRGLQAIVDELGARGVDARFGVAEYRDYPLAVYGNNLAGDRPYVLARRLGAADGELAAALARLQAGGGGDFPEAQLTALYQAVTGAGDAAGLVPGGGQAGFRPEALGVIVNVTDAPFHDDPAHPSPPGAAVARELRARGVLQVGLAVYGPQGLSGARRDLSKIAEATGARAAEAVDCDGDGDTELGAHEPLVCPVTGRINAGEGGLAPAIVALLDAVRDEAPVGLAAGSGRRLVRAIAPGLLPRVDVKDPQTLTFEVTLSCPPALAGKSHVVELFAHVRATAVARTALQVDCLAPSAALEAPPPLPPAAPAAARPAAAPAPPPPQPPEQLPQQQPNAQSQGALGHQEQEEPQVAYVAAVRRALGGETYALSPAGPEPLPLGAATVLAAALGAALRTGQALARRRR